MISLLLGVLTSVTPNFSIFLINLYFGTFFDYLIYVTYINEVKMTEKQQKEAEDKFTSYTKKQLTEVDIEKAHKKSKNLGDQIENFKLLMSLAKDALAGRYKISKMDLAIITGAIIYVVSPIDAIPDFIPMAGWLDDIGVIALAMNKLNTVIEDYKIWKETIKV